MLGVRFFFFASDFSALRVSFRPFAARYASTAGTRSAGCADIAEVVLRATRAEEFVRGVGRKGRRRKCFFWFFWQRSRRRSPITCSFFTGIRS